MKKAFFISIVVVLVIFSCLQSFWNNWLPKQVSEKQIWISSNKNKKFTYAFLGSSRVYTCVSAKLIEELTSEKTINLGTDGASLMENYVLLNEFIAAGNTINTLYLQIDKSALINMKEAYSYPFHDYLFLNRLSEKHIKESFIDANGELKYWFWRRIPFVKYAEFNNFYSVNKLISNNRNSMPQFDVMQGDRLDDIKMNDSCLAVLRNGFVNDTFIVNDNSIKYLNLILETCKKNNIKCNLFKVPIYDEIYTNYNSSLTSEKYIKKYAASKKIDFLDFQKGTISKNKNYFKDRTHLNKEGAIAFSTFLTDSLNL